jgi:hypothetical protein
MKTETEKIKRGRTCNLVEIVELEDVRPSFRGPSDQLGSVDLIDGFRARSRSSVSK